jgi:molecular chaperone GrpE
MRRQVEETAQFAIRKFAKDLLDTVDILGMALKSVPKEQVEGEGANTTLKNLYTGVSMTEAELLKTLKRHGVEPFDALGAEFDPNWHQALFHVPVPDKTPGTVFQVEKHKNRRILVRLYKILCVLKLHGYRPRLKVYCTR